MTKLFSDQWIRENCPEYQPTSLKLAKELARDSSGNVRENIDPPRNVQTLLNRASVLDRERLMDRARAMTPLNELGESIRRIEALRRMDETRESATLSRKELKERREFLALYPYAYDEMPLDMVSNERQIARQRYGDSEMRLALGRENNRKIKLENAYRRRVDILVRDALSEGMSDLAIDAFSEESNERFKNLIDTENSLLTDKELNEGILFLLKIQHIKEPEVEQFRLSILKSNPDANVRQVQEKVLDILTTEGALSEFISTKGDSLETASERRMEARDRRLPEQLKEFYSQSESIPEFRSNLRGGESGEVE